MKISLAAETKKSQLVLIAVSIALWIVAIALAPVPLINLGLTFVSVVVWSYVRLARFISNLYLRRGLKFLPYALPLFAVGLPSVESARAFSISVGIGLFLGLVFQLLNVRSLRKGLNRRLLALMPKPSSEQAWSESLFFLAPAIAQEYLYRFAALFALTASGMPPWGAVLTTALLFAGEHLFGVGAHTARSFRNVFQWVLMGIVLGAASVLTGSPVAAMTAHLIINLPSAVRPHLRGKSVAS